MISTSGLKKAGNIAKEDREHELFLIDGSGFIFRAYHALPPLTSPNGTPVNAVLGFTNMLLKLITEMHVPNIAVIFDAGRENFRHKIYPEYKANRKETPEDLIPQFPLIRKATEAFAVPSIEKIGYEADDLIATYVKLAREKGYPVTIVSSDKDLTQLLGEGVRIFDPMKYKHIEESDVIDKFGVTPDKVVEVQSLAGDTSDNIPGIPGIGVKTAAELINQYGDLENLLAHAHEIKQNKRRETLIANAELAKISKQLVQLATDVPIDVKIEALKTKTPDAKKLMSFLEEQGFRSIIAKVDKIFKNMDVSEATPTEQSYELVQDVSQLQRWIDMSKKAGIVAIDTETTSLTPAKAELVGISMSTARGKACYIPLQHKDPNACSGSFDFSGEQATQDLKQIPLATALAMLKPLLEDKSVIKIGHNIKYDMQLFLKHGIKPYPVEDTMLISYVLDGSTHSHSMDNLAKTLLDIDTIKFGDVTGKGKSQITFDFVPLDKALTYAAEDADVTLQLYNALKPRLVQEEMTSVYETVELPLTYVIAEMELNGIKVDINVLKNLSADCSKKLADLEQTIFAIAGTPFNIASPKQVGEILFENLGINGGKKTRGGGWSTDAGVLEEIAEQGHEIAERILEWREFAKLKSTYTDALPLSINPKTGRIHTSFSLAGTNTGRLASSDPNLQNIPIRTEYGKKIRAAFVAEKGYKLLSADYSQVELRIIAELGNIKALKQAFHDDIDIHAATASQVFSVPLDKMTPEIRRQAKAINFGIIYGISPFGLAKQLGIPQHEAANYIKRYFASFPELADFMEKSKEYARKHGYVKTLYGRKCFISGINDKNSSIRNFAERQAINAPMQGTAADIIKMAMIALNPALKQSGLKAKMLLQVHDELVFEVPVEEVEETRKLVVSIMESAAAGISVPLKVETGCADNWADAH